MLYHLAHPTELAGIIAGLLTALLAHNVAQVWAARALGDPTALRGGFSSFSASRYIGVYGAVAAVLVGTGWAEPIPVATRFRRSERRAAVALAAGPVAALVVTGLWVLAAVALNASSVVVGSDTAGLAGAVQPAASGLLRGVLYAVGAAGTAAVLSVLPMPPLAGGRILFLLAPKTLGWQRARQRLVDSPIGSYIVLAIILGPLVLPGLPKVVPQCATPVIAAMLRAAGVRTFTG